MKPVIPNHKDAVMFIVFFVMMFAMVSTFAAPDLLTSLLP